MKNIVAQLAMESAQPEGFGWYSCRIICLPSSNWPSLTTAPITLCRVAVGQRIQPVNLWRNDVIDHSTSVRPWRPLDWHHLSVSKNRRQRDAQVVSLVKSPGALLQIIPRFDVRGNLMLGGINPSMDWFVGENLQETHGFLPSNMGLSCKFSHHPILWIPISSWDCPFWWLSSPFWLKYRNSLTWK